MADTRTLEILVKVKDLATKALGGIQGAIAKFAGAAKAAFTQIAIGALRQLGAELLAIPGKLIAAGEAFLKHADDVQKLSAALGTSVESFQEMTFAAGQSGLSQENLSASSKFLVKAMEEARTKSGDTRLIFQKLGLDVDTLGDSQLDLVDIYAKLADGLKGIQSPTERAAVLMKLFGRSGHEMALLLSEGSVGIRAIAKDFRDLGGALSAETVRLADALADEINRAKAAVQGIFNAVIKDTLPKLKTGVTAFVDFIKENRTKIVDDLRDTAAGVGSTLGAIGLVVGVLSDIFRTAVNQLTVVVLAFKTAFAFIKKFATDTAASATEFEVAMEALRAAVSDFTTESVFKNTAKIDKLVEAIKNIGKGSKDAAKDVKVLADAMDETPTRAGFFEGFEKGLEEFKLNLDDMVSAGQKAAQELASGTQGALSNFFEGIVDGSKNAKEALKQLGEDFKRILAKMVADYLAAQLVMQLFGLGAPVGYGVPGGKIGPAPPPSAAGGRGGPLSFGGGRRGGGPNSVLPPPGGLGGGGGAQVNITINAVDAEGLDRLLVRKRETLTNILINALAHRRDLIVDVRGA